MASLVAHAENDALLRQQGWEEFRTPGPYGRVYWQNTSTGETCFTKPKCNPVPVADLVEPNSRTASVSSGGMVGDGGNQSLESHTGTHQQQPRVSFAPPTADSVSESNSKQQYHTPPRKPNRNMVVSPLCSRCSRFVGELERHAVLHEHRIHERCFTCNACNKSLCKVDFMEHQSCTYCVECFERLHAPRCPGCRCPCRVNEKLVKASSFTWHELCFRCVDCGRVITDQYSPGPRCKECMQIHADPLRKLGEKGLLLISTDQNDTDGVLLHRCSRKHRVQTLSRFGFCATCVSSDGVQGVYLVCKSWLLHLPDLLGKQVDEVGTLRLTRTGGVLTRGVRGLTLVDLEGLRHLFAFAPHGSLSVDRDTAVHIDPATGVTQVLFSTDLADAVDMTVRLTHATDESLHLEFYFWSHSRGLLSISVVVEAELVRVKSIGVLRPVPMTGPPPANIVGIAVASGDAGLLLVARDSSGASILLQSPLDVYNDDGAAAAAAAKRTAKPMVRLPPCVEGLSMAAAVGLIDVADKPMQFGMDLPPPSPPPTPIPLSASIDASDDLGETKDFDAAKSYVCWEDDDECYSEESPHLQKLQKLEPLLQASMRRHGLEVLMRRGGQQVGGSSGTS